MAPDVTHRRFSSAVAEVTVGAFYGCPRGAGPGRRVAYCILPVARWGLGKIGFAYGHHRATVCCDQIDPGRHDT